MTTVSKPEKRLLDEKIFMAEDQQLFALLSSDYNPMHTDAVAARRLITGRRVVHGIHILLTAFEYWHNDSNVHPLSVSCSFNNPVSVGERIIFTQHNRALNEFVIEATVNGLLCSQIIITTAQRSDQSKMETGLAEFAPGKKIYFPDALTKPLNEAPQFHIDKKYMIKLNDEDYLDKFPQSYRYFGKEGVSAISALSYFVGMVCPGLHSIFSSLSFKLNPDPANNGLIAFEVKKYNERYRLFDISFRGYIEGSIKAFLRPPPHRQPLLKDLSTHVDPQEFHGTKSLIIGGSRGLGELTAKIVASGGGEVIITYASGLDDAKKINDEINTGNTGKCQFVKFDLTTDSFSSMNIDCNSLDTIYFFATPRIGRSKADFFEPHLFQEFSEFYIQKFYELCVYLEANITEKKIKIFYPSTIYVSERPEGMTEYAMAKAAAEVLIEEINKSFTKLTVLSTRLPRLNTDQTSAIVKMATESNIETLLPVVRSLNKLK